MNPSIVQAVEKTQMLVITCKMSPTHKKPMWSTSLNANEHPTLLAAVSVATGLLIRPTIMETTFDHGITRMMEKDPETSFVLRWNAFSDKQWTIDGEDMYAGTYYEGSDPGSR